MRTFTLQIPGFTIACKAHGNQEKKPILALHGWLDNANSFDLLAKHLGNDVHLVAIDLPGHGLSSHLPKGCHYHFMDGVFTTLEIIRALGWDGQAHLLGHSMGACLASLIAGVAPGRIASVAMIEGLGPLSAPEDSSQRQLAQYASQWLTVSDTSPKPYPDLRTAARARSMGGYISIELAEMLCERGLRETNGTWYWRHDRKLLMHSPLRMTENQVLNCLGAITAPALLIMAEHGFAYPAEAMDIRKNAVPGLTISTLEGGHHIHMEKPEAVARLLVDFWKD